MLKTKVKQKSDIAKTNFKMLKHGLVKAIPNKALDLKTIAINFLNLT